MILVWTEQKTQMPTPQQWLSTGAQMDHRGPCNIPGASQAERNKLGGGAHSAIFNFRTDVFIAQSFHQVFLRYGPCGHRLRTTKIIQLL